MAVRYDADDDAREIGSYPRGGTHRAVDENVARRHRRLEALVRAHRPQVPWGPERPALVARVLHRDGAHACRVVVVRAAKGHALRSLENVRLLRLGAEARERRRELERARQP